MANDIAYGLVLLVFVGAIVAYVYWPRPPRTVVQQRTGPTMVLVEPALTPLRDSGPANNARRPTARQPAGTGARTGTSRPGSSRGGGGPRAGAPAAQTPTRTGAKQPPRKRRPATSPSRPAPQPQQQPPQSTNPPPSVSVPLPSVCVPPLKVGACP
jgi:hypothetical protein